MNSVFSFQFPWKKEERSFYPVTKITRSDGIYKNIYYYNKSSTETEYYCDMKETFFSVEINSKLKKEGNFRTEKKIIGLCYSSTSGIRIEQISGLTQSYSNVEDGVTYHYFEIPYSNKSTVLCFSVDPDRNTGSAEFFVRVFGDKFDDSLNIDSDSKIFFLTQKELDGLK